MKAEIIDKLQTLAESAKYDVSCASSGTTRKNTPGGIGSTAGWGICHSFTEDGRCVSLLKIMLTNYCIYDCAYCINRRSNDLKRATFSVSEFSKAYCKTRKIGRNFDQHLGLHLLGKVHKWLLERATIQIIRYYARRSIYTIDQVWSEFITQVIFQ